jgi:hypothetical protein
MILEGINRDALDGSEDLSAFEGAAEIAEHIKEKYSLSDNRQIAFIIEYIRTGKVFKSYQAVYGDHLGNKSAGVMGHDLLVKLRFTVIDFLDMSGHGLGKMVRAMDALFRKNPAEYMRYQSKLRGLDKQEIALSGSVTIPNLTIVSSAPKVEE